MKIFRTESVKYCVLLSAGIYIITFLVGFLVIMPVELNSLFSSSFNTTSTLQQDNSTFDFYYIIKSNMYAVLILLSGSFMLGFSTFATLAFNGFAFGAMVCTMLKNGAPFSSIFLLTFPHAILEVPSIWIAGAAGFKFPYELVRYFSNKKDYILNREDIKEFVSLAGIAIILIVIAAFVEASVTMKIAQTIK